MQVDERYTFQLLNELVELDAVFLPFRDNEADWERKLFHFLLMEDDGLVDVNQRVIAGVYEDGDLVEYGVRVTLKGLQQHKAALEEAGDGDD